MPEEETSPTSPPPSPGARNKKRVLRPLPTLAGGPPTGAPVIPGALSPEERLRLAQNAPVQQRVAHHDTLAKSSPLSLCFQLIGCEYAQFDFAHATGAIPGYEWSWPCPFGKSIPDQDCRDCAHVRLHMVGQEQQPHKHRYHRHGMVVPVTEEVADQVLTLAYEQGAEPLRRPDWEAHVAEQERAIEEVRKAREYAQELEQRQLGPHGRLPQ